jgi:hypothetical protein
MLKVCAGLGITLRTIYAPALPFLQPADSYPSAVRSTDSFASGRGSSSPAILRNSSARLRQCSASSIEIITPVSLRSGGLVTSTQVAQRHICHAVLKTMAPTTGDAIGAVGERLWRGVLCMGAAPTAILSSKVLMTA